jgi:hypothetical protein
MNGKALWLFVAGCWTASLDKLRLDQYPLLDVRLAVVKPLLREVDQVDFHPGRWISTTQQQAAWYRLCP